MIIFPTLLVDKLIEIQTKKLNTFSQIDLRLK